MAIKRYTVEIDGKEVEVVLAQEHETSIANSVAKSTRLEGELAAAKQANAEAEALKAQLTAKDEEIKKLGGEVSAKEKSLKLIEIFDKEVSASTLAELGEIKLLRDADLSTPESITALKESFKSKFPQFYATVSEGGENKEGQAAGSFKPILGGAGGNNAGNTIVKTVGDLKGMTTEQINTVFNEKLGI